MARWWIPNPNKDRAVDIARFFVFLMDSERCYSVNEFDLYLMATHKGKYSRWHHSKYKIVIEKDGKDVGTLGIVKTSYGISSFNNADNRIYRFLSVADPLIIILNDQWQAYQLYLKYGGDK